jgi:hypothetical protein
MRVCRVTSGMHSVGNDSNGDREDFTHSIIYAKEDEDASLRRMSWGICQVLVT